MHRNNFIYSWHVLYLLFYFQEISSSILQFDKASSQKRTITRDRSHPRLFDLDLEREVKVTEGARSPEMQDMTERQLRMNAVMEEAQEMLEHNRVGFIFKEKQEDKDYGSSLQEELLDISPVGNEEHDKHAFECLREVEISGNESITDAVNKDEAASLSTSEKDATNMKDEEQDIKVKTQIVADKSAFETNKVHKSEQNFGLGDATVNKKFF